MSSVISPINGITLLNVRKQFLRSITRFFSFGASPAEPELRAPLLRSIAYGKAAYTRRRSCRKMASRCATVPSPSKR